MALLAGSVLLAATTLTFSAYPASANTAAEEQEFIQRINDLRVQQGLSPLAVDAELTVQANTWNTEMAQKDQLLHDNDLANGISSDWSTLGENVGFANPPDIDTLFQAFVDSSSHYANLVDPTYTHVGVAVMYDAEGKLWTTHRFMAEQLVVEPPPTTTPPTTTPPPTTTAAPPPPTTTVPPTVPVPLPTEPPPKVDVNLVAEILEAIDQ